MNAEPIRELWSRLAAAGLAPGAMPAPREGHTPWYVRVMLGVAGFIAALFLVGFVGAAFAGLMKSEAARMVFGLAMIASAYGLFRAAPRSDFGAMFALSVSFAGQAMLAWSLFDLMRPRFGSLPWALLAALEAILALVVPNVIHRVASAYAAGVAFMFAMAATGAGALALAVGVLAAAVAALWLNELRLGRFHELLAPVGYGLTLAYIQAEISSDFGDAMLRLMTQRSPDDPSLRPWVGQALVAATLVITAAALLRRAGWILSATRSVLALASVVAIGAASFKASGVAGGLMIVLLGFANGNRVLAGAGIAALLFYISKYYYLLDATLLAKSGVLALTGAALLGARWLVLNLVLPKSGDA